MADNFNITPGTGVTIGADDVGGGVLHQRVKVSLGVDGTGTDLSPGQKTGANSIPVVLASDQTPLFNRGSFTDRSGTITTGGTSQQIAAANANRKYFYILNLSTAVIWVNFGVAAVQLQPSIPLLVASTSKTGGGSLLFDGFVPTDAINVVCATAGSAWVAKEG